MTILFPTLTNRRQGIVSDCFGKLCFEEIETKVVVGLDGLWNGKNPCFQEKGSIRTLWDRYPAGARGARMTGCYGRFFWGGAWVWIACAVGMAQEEKVVHLPFHAGKTVRITQGNNQKHGKAFDFGVRVGTRILAVEGGVVLGVREDRVGPTGKAKDNNFVTIRHEDGTVAYYGHLRHQGVMVERGQTVRRGEHIAFSGNSGKSSGPHLHFAIFRKRGGKMIPIRFIGVEPGRALRRGDRVTSQNSAPE